MKQFSIPTEYRSQLISSIKKNRREADKQKKDFTPSILDFGVFEIYLARHFGFCYGVENAIEIAFKTVEENPDKRIFLLSEMIHNPFVNDDLTQRGVKFLMDTHGNQLIPFESLTAEDIVMIPAFGTTKPIENTLKSIGIQIEKYNTTCPFVEKVWNRAEQIAEKGYSVVVHGKPSHEETKATFSHSQSNTPTLVLNDMAEAIMLGEFILGHKNKTEFNTYFNGRMSETFDLDRDLAKFGVVNQTTMLATDTQEIADYLKSIMVKKYNLGDAEIATRFADTRDTLCYATNDNQTAVRNLLHHKADLAIVIGGRKSSNSSHLVELCEHELPTYFIESELDLISEVAIKGYNWKTKDEYIQHNYLPTKDKTRILMTSGASCPDAIVEAVIEKISTFFKGSKNMNEVKSSWY
ncbi:MAG: 4-hydroxy-3-methylbut-2-enyl diphosphate reductase [Chitinophagaceae bacterium]|nr:MAG: 4-hydroxy-3-methylbut-2-enyl diphosphate reductase [Chitinophagaceae bacterium]